MADIRVRVEEVVRLFHELENPRCTINPKHPLDCVIVIAIMEALAGASGPTSIAKWAKRNTQFLFAHDKKNNLGTLHSVSLRASEYGLPLGQVACAEKSNEITAIPEPLRLIDVTGAIISFEHEANRRQIQPLRRKVGGLSDAQSRFCQKDCQLDGSMGAAFSR